MGSLDIKRGDIFLINTKYNFDTKTWITKPFLVIQNDIGNEYSPTIVVAAITTEIIKAKIPTHVGLSSGVSGLENDSVVLAEHITTYDKRRFQTKIGELNNSYMIMVENAILVSIGKLVPKNEVYSFGHCVSKSDIFTFENTANQYKNYIDKLTRPIIITEGKTDVKYLKIAWEKLYPNEEIYFDCIPSGLQVDEEMRTGGSNTVRQALENLSIIDSRTIIGLFDNDRSGNTEFNSLSNKKNKIFQQDSLKYNLKKHIEKNIWAMLLPVPEERELFVTLNDINQRYFSIEHYFSDEVLKKHNMNGKNILRTEVFEISGDKNSFSQKIEKLDASEFVNFKVLFEEIKNILNDVNN